MSECPTCGDTFKSEHGVKIHHYQVEEFEKRVYRQLDGMGSEMAERLYDTYPTLPSALEASTSDLMEIEGIGESRAMQIQEELHGH